MRLLASAVIWLAFASCSSGKPNESDAPAWVHQPARTVDGGYIVYVGTGEDRVLERSRFKAEGMALQDVANECSFPPKGTRTETYFDEVDAGVHRSYAKVAVEFQDCEAAKTAVEPEAVRKLANVAQTEEIKRYQEMVDSPEPEEVQGLPVASNGTPGQPIGGDTQFFVVRQQIWYAKQVVILSPPGYYVAGTPQYTVYTRAVAPATASVINYQAVHPQVQTWPRTFSTSRPNWVAHQSTALRPYGNAPRAMGAQSYARAQQRPQARAQQRHAERRKKKRRREER
jgi:hypothetical protein